MNAETLVPISKKLALQSVSTNQNSNEPRSITSQPHIENSNFVFHWMQIYEEFFQLYSVFKVFNMGTENTFSSLFLL